MPTDVVPDPSDRRPAHDLATAELSVRAARVQLTEVAADAPEALVATSHYFAELDALFPAGFDPGPAAPEPDAAWVVAVSDGVPVAFGGIRPAPGVGAHVTEIKRMWVDAAWRGVGLGARMLRHLEDLARARGHDRVVLDTNGRLHGAIAMYDRAGYRRIERYNDNPYAEVFFTKEL